MKEKTFEDLAEYHAWYDRSDYAKKEPFLDKADVLKLLQQVREATIAECANIVHHSEGIYDSLNELQGKKVHYFDIKSLPTDRILTP